MDKRITIKTNLKSALILYSFIVLTLGIYYLTNRHIGNLIIFILASTYFIYYILSKHLFVIIINNEEVTVKYLQGNIKTIKYEKSALNVKMKTEVLFRGGRNEIFEVISLVTGKKVAEINERQFRNDYDFDEFLNIFQIRR